MPNYYKGNAIYTELEKQGDIPFVWTSENSWILLYGDSTANVKLIAAVQGQSINNADSKTLSRIIDTQIKASELAETARIPFITIEFDDEAEVIDSAKVDGRAISLGELKNRFHKAGLPVTGGSTSKAINKAASSAYHEWQRTNLGAIKVSDIDLMRLDSKKNKVKEIYELKRSYIALEKWRPYPADFPNFDVIEYLISRVDVRFTILYNVRSTSPFHDDPSRVALFSYSHKGGPKSLGILSFDAFLAEGTPK